MSKRSTRELLILANKSFQMSNNASVVANPGSPRSRSRSPDAAACTEQTQPPAMPQTAAQSPAVATSARTSASKVKKEEEWSGHARVNVGGDIENIQVPIGTTIWCGWQGKMWSITAGAKPNAWKPFDEGKRFVSLAEARKWVAEADKKDNAAAAALGTLG